MCTRTRARLVDREAGEAPAELLQGHAALEPGQRRAEADSAPPGRGRAAVGMPRPTSKRSGSGYSRSSRFAAPVSSRMRSPAGTVVPYHSTSRVIAAALRTAPATTSAAPPRPRPGSRRVRQDRGPLARDGARTARAAIRQQLGHRLAAGGAQQGAEADDLAVGERVVGPSSSSTSASSSAADEPVVRRRREVLDEPEPVARQLRHRFDARARGTAAVPWIARRATRPSTRGAADGRPRARRGA